MDRHPKTDSITSFPGDGQYYFLPWEIEYDSEAALKQQGKPVCAFNNTLDPTIAASFAFQPPGCVAEKCTAVRALIYSLISEEIAHSEPYLYTCEAIVPVDAVSPCSTEPWPRR